MGGRVAEELIFGREKVTTGASNDIAQATAIARKMVTEWGMSDKLGPLRYNENQEEIFLGHSVAQQKNVSDATAEVIDQEVRAIVDNADESCRKILTDNIQDLHTLAKALLEYETLTGDEIKALLRGEPIVREKDDDIVPPSGVRSSVPTTGSAPLGPGPTPEPQGG
jgi:cell division protease FtsH